MNTDNSEAMRLADYARGDEYQRAADDAVDLLRKQSARIAELEAERDEHQATAIALISLLADIRKACGDNGKRMQPEIVEFIGSITTERDQLRAEVIANRERDALKLAALHIHSEMRSIVQAGGSNEAIGREFRKRVILDIEDEVVKLRADVERLTKTDAEILASNYPDGEENGPTISAPDFELIAFARQLGIKDAARTTHKETE